MSDAPDVELSGDEVLQALFESPPCGIALLGPDGRFRRANQRLQRILGYSETELTTRTLVELTHTGDAAVEIACFEELLARSRSEYQLHKRCVHRGGGVVWARQTVARRERADGPILVATIEDITAARGTEERLHQLVYQLGERVKELTALHHTARLLLHAPGTREEHLRLVAQLLPAAMQYPEITTGCVRYGEEVYAAGDHRPSRWVLTSSFQTADGAAGAIEVAYHEPRPEAATGPFLEEEVSLLGSLGEMIRAAIDRQNGERALEEANTRMSFAFAAAGMGIWEWNVPRNLVRWSKSLSRMLGIEGETFGPFGQYRGLVHDEDRDRLFERLARAAEGKDDLQRVPLRMRSAGGEWLHFEASAMLPQEPAGPPTTIIVAMIEVSGRYVWQR